MTASRVTIAPEDEANERLVAAVHPPGWVNPEPPAGRYNAVVIGAGTAGLVTAAGTAGLGGKVALIERHLMGGDCLNVGCVPSKALIRCARAAAEARAGARYGVATGAIEVDFAAVMERMRRLRAGIAPVDGAARFRELGVDVYLGDGRFVSPREVEVGGARLAFARAVIATGGRAFVPPIPGLEDAGYLTNDSVFELTELPRRLVVIGGGPIGCELAQSFARFGAKVTLLEALPAIMGKEDGDAAAIVARHLAADGVDVRTGAGIAAVDPDGTVVIGSGDTTERIACDAILVATGRRANVEGLGLDAAGVEASERGVVVDGRMRTTNKRIYAAGDVASPYQFTHAADAMARLAIRNALFFGRQKIDDLVIPRVTFTDPEVAAVGLTVAEAEQRGVAVDIFEQKLEHVDRAIVDGATDGFFRVLVNKGSDEIVGATLVGPHAGELLGEVTLAMTSGAGLGAIAGAIHAYPTLSLGLRQLADQYQRTRLTPFVARVFRWILARRR